jgi:hypothetical protein
MDLLHPLVKEFPEHRNTISHLRGADEKFRHAYDEYHQVDQSVYRFEEEIEYATDQEIEELKYKRARLKDYLYHALMHTPALH